MNKWLPGRPERLGQLQEGGGLGGGVARGSWWPVALQPEWPGRQALPFSAQQRYVTEQCPLQMGRQGCSQESRALREGRRFHHVYPFY